MQKTCCLVNGWYMTFLNPGLYGIGLVACCWRRCQSLGIYGRVRGFVALDVDGKYSA